jgi:hypothetical protein
MRNLTLVAALGLLGCVLVLSGCVVGQSLPATYEATQASDSAGGAKVAV